MSAIFTSRLAIFNPPSITLNLAQQITEYTAQLLNAGASTFLLRNEGLARRNFVDNADFKVLNEIFSQAPHAENLATKLTNKRLALPERQQALKAHLHSSLMQSTEEKNSPHRDFRTIVDAHKHKKKR